MKLLGQIFQFRKKVIGTFILLLFCVTHITTLQSQNVSYQTLYSNSTLENKPVNTNLQVGSIEGSATVSQGSANYTIPIQLPAGTNNVVPSVTVMYQSQSGDGFMGVGWNLIGLSAITRNIKSFYHDGFVGPANVDGNDRFAIDGVRLISTTGTYGATNATYSKESEDFSRVTSFGTSGTGPTYFTVETKEGVVMEYGNTTDSRFMSKNNVDVLLWKINKIKYKDGNYIDYIYETINNEIRIKEIKYTGNDLISPPLMPYNTITFEYQARDANQKFKNTTYEVDRAIALNSLLTKITINADGQLFKSYTFNYANNNINVFLNEVIEIGSDGISSLNSTIFKYGDQPTQTTSVWIGFSNSNGNDLISGDFNGDGFTDIATANRFVENGNVYHTSFSLYTKQKANNNLFDFRYTKTLPIKGLIGKQNSSYNILASDFNGDGLDDLAYVLTDLWNCAPYSDSGRKFSELRIYLSNSTFQNPPEIVVTLPINTHTRVVDIGNFFTIGDYNGDGIQDVFVTTLKNRTCPGTSGNPSNDELSKGFIWYGNSGNTTFTELSILGTAQFQFNSNGSTVNWSTKNINTIDFDGDGKSEIMITKGGWSEIFSFPINTAISRLQLSGFPTEWHLMFFGDFNGDRKTDILTRSALDDNNASWSIAKSTGKVWVENPFSWFPVPIAGSFPSINGLYQGDKVLVSDFNGDGKSDIIHHRNVNVQSEINTNYSQGNSFIYNSQSFNQIHSSINVIGDFNGDSKSDFLNRTSITASSSIIYMNSLGQELLLQRVKNGEGHITQFTYNRMCESGGHYSKSISSSYPYTSASLPMYLVTRIDKDNLVETTYNYYDGILHRKGKGFLGFRSVTENGPINGATVKGKDSGARAYSGPTRYNHKQHNYFNLNTTHAMLVLDSIVNLKGNERLNKKTITNEIVQQNVGVLEKILWHKTPIVKDENIFENTVTEANNTTYDTDGNVTHSNIIYYSKSGSTLTEVSRVFTVSVFGMFGSFRKNVPTQITNTTTRAGQIAYSSTVDFTYNTKGQLLTKIDFPNQPKAVTQTYTYNSLGNISGLTISAPNLSSRSTTNIYDSKGRYIETSTNAAGQTSSATYDTRWAKPLTSTGVDGIKSKFEYDEFGRLKKTFYRKDLTDEFSTTLGYFWGPFGTSFYTLYSHPGKPDVKTYFDNLGRKVIQETEGFQGHWIKESYTYDGNGNVTLHNGPHRPTAGESSGLHTTSVFDDYGRLKTVTNSFRTIEFTYDYTNGQKKVTQTLDLPLGQTDQVSSQTTDVTGQIVSTSDASGTLNFTYYSHGKIKDIKRGTITYSSMLYDNYARQTRLTDINSGITTYEYNAFGELFKENQASGNNLTYLYNTLGNITSRSGTEGTTSYTYYASGVKINKLEKVTSFTTGYEESYAYDNVYGKLQSKSEKINNTNFVTSFTYNKYDDLLTTTYPSLVAVTNEYDSNGYLTNVKNGSTTLFTNQGMTAHNNYKTYQYGNGLITDVTYNQTIPTRFYARNSNASIKRQDLNLAWNYGTGNLTSRTDALVNKTESFLYDIMNRLTSAQVGTNTALTMNYSNDGNMTIKSDGAGPGGLEYLHSSKINAITKVQNPIVIPLNTQNITYGVYQRTTNISENLKTLDLSYSYDYERRMGIFKTNNVTDETRWYVGNYEKQTIGSITREIHYVSNGERLIAIIVKEGSTVTNNYVHTDHLGSILAITNNAMAYVTRQNYDPWGRKRNVDTWTYSGVQSVPTWLYRGYTGHEEYAQFNLINMNARLYDPHTGRMLSPDIAVTMPYSSQGYNRYSYANNNPLKFIDPDGNEPVTLTAILLVSIIKGAIGGAAIGVAMNGISNMIQDKNFFDGWGKAAIIGAVAGGISSGIGTIAGNIVGATKLEVALAQGMMHGWSGALHSMLQGGNPGTGFISGFASSVTASSVQSLGGGKIATLIGGALSGGVGSAVVGGNFYRGATFGLISTSLNHLSHEVGNSIVNAMNNGGPGDPVKPVPAEYKKAGGLPGYPDAEYKGSRGGRPMWTTKKEVLEWDYKRGEIEVYDKSGKTHKGAYDPVKQEMRPNSQVKGRLANSVRFLSVWNVIGAWMDSTWYIWEPMIYPQGRDYYNNLKS